MNEYQDQVVWFRLEVGADREFVGDYDTREEAALAAVPFLDGRRVWVNRMYGLPA